MICFVSKNVCVVTIESNRSQWLNFGHKTINLSYSIEMNIWDAGRRLYVLVCLSCCYVMWWCDRKQKKNYIYTLSQLSKCSRRRRRQSMTNDKQKKQQDKQRQARQTLSVPIFFSSPRNSIPMPSLHQIQYHMTPRIETDRQTR